MPATLDHPRIARVELKIPEPKPTGRSNVETEYSLDLYNGLRLKTIDNHTTDFEGVVRLLSKYGTRNVVLVACEFQRDIEGDPHDLRTCEWDDESGTWSAWRAKK